MLSPSLLSLCVPQSSVSVRAKFRAAHTLHMCVSPKTHSATSGELLAILRVDLCQVTPSITIIITIPTLTSRTHFDRFSQDQGTQCTLHPLSISSEFGLQSPNNSPQSLLLGRTAALYNQPWLLARRSSSRSSSWVTRVLERHHS